MKIRPPLVPVPYTTPSWGQLADRIGYILIRDAGFNEKDAQALASEIIDNIRVWIQEQKRVV